MHPIAHHKNLDFSSEIDEAIPAYFSGLRSYIDRTLLNLLSNALKFTKKGSVKLKIETLNKPNTSYRVGDKINLKISVKDTGIGIPEDKFTTIFEHFSRLTPSYQGLYKGAGLGLYTVKRYIEAMQADIKLESMLGKGSCFTISLPLSVSDHSDREKISFREEKTFKNLKPETCLNLSILIVEDNLLAAKSVQANLKYLNIENTEVAENGLQALKMVQERDYDLILMDIGLPDMDGIEVTRKIRALNYQTPILALTGHGSEPEIKEEALAAGMQDVLLKPLQIHKLKTVLELYFVKKNEVKILVVNKKSCSEKQSKVIDWKATVLNMNGDEDCVRELLAILAEDLKLTKEKLADAYASKDIKALCEELHKVQGGLAYLVLPQLDFTLVKFHKALKEVPQNQSKLDKTYSQLQKAMEDFWLVWNEFY